VAAPHPATQLPASQLRQLLAERFDNEELQTICFDLGIDPDNLPGQAKSARARELISYLERRNQLGKLYTWIRQHRIDIDLG
jgi:hypothetical protein